VPERVLSTPNRMVWQYSECLRRLAQDACEQQEGNPQRQTVAVCIFLAVTVVESFLNLFVRILIEQPEYACYRAKILSDLNSRIPLDRKVRAWPQLLFGRAWDQSTGSGKQFSDLKDKRNELMHFTSTHESVTEIPGVLIHGLADTIVFDSLQAQDAALAVRVAEESICALLELAGQSPEGAARGLHYWTGRAPSNYNMNSSAEGGRSEG
jgi:hypothetical protein